VEPKEKKKKDKNNLCLDVKSDVPPDIAEDDELPDLLVRDDDSSVSDDESVPIYKHMGFNTEKCALEIWADEMIEYCEEELKKENLEAKKKRRKQKRKKQKNITVNKTVESNITLKKDSIPTPPLLFC